MADVELDPITPSARWAPRTGPVPSHTMPERTVSWQADRGWMSDEYAGAPNDPPPDAEGMEVVL